MEWAFEMIQQLANYQFFIAILVSLVAGFLTSLDPCVLGMASSVFAFQDKDKNKNMLPVAIVFLTSFTLAFTLLGTVSIYFGDQILSWSKESEEVFRFIIGTILVITGSLLIGIKFQDIFKYLPFIIVSFYSNRKRKFKSSTVQSADSVLKAGSLGTVFGLTPWPCSSAMILATITYSSATGSIGKGIVLLVMYGIGHSIPFLLIGWFSTLLNSDRLIRIKQVLNIIIGLGLIVFGFYFYFK